MGFWKNLGAFGEAVKQTVNERGKNSSLLPFSMGGRLLGNPGGMPGLEEYKRGYYKNIPFRRGGQIRVIGMPNITMKKKRKCKRCKRK
jgi:hypothetical protein